MRQTTHATTTPRKFINKNYKLNLMLKTYKFRLYPSKKQELKLNQFIELARFSYNKQLELNNNLIKLKEENKNLTQLHSQVLQNINQRINYAFNNFFRRLKSKENPGFPRFKGKNKYDSITYPQSGFKLENKLYLSKIGKINIVKHRQLEGNIKTLTITKTSSNKWFACFSAEKEVKKQNRIENHIGIDLGLKHFYADSEGNLINNPKYLRKSELKLIKTCKNHSRKKKGRKNRL